jgi:hypothetical protein
MNCYIVSKAYTTLFLCALCCALAFPALSARAANVSAATTSSKPVIAPSVAPATEYSGKEYSKYSGTGYVFLS